MKINDQLKKMLINSINANVVPALMGEPAIGKTSIYAEVAKEMDAAYFEVAINQMAAKEDLTGAKLVPTDDGSSFRQMFFPHYDLDEAITYAENNPDQLVIVDLDEINRSTPDVTSGVMSLSTMRKIGSRKIPDNVRFVVTGNDKGNVTVLDSASISRFAIFHVEPDAEAWMDWMREKGKLNPIFESILDDYPNYIFCKPVSQEVNIDELSDDLDEDAMQQFTAPRTLTYLSNVLEKTDENDLREWMLIPVGDGEKTMLSEYLKSYTGDTAFTAELISRLTKKLQTTAPNATKGVATESTFGPTSPKPKNYTKLIKATSTSEMNQIMEQMSQEDLNAALVWMLVSKQDATSRIRLLMSNIKQLTTIVRQDVFRLVSGNRQGLNPSNFYAATSLNLDTSNDLKNLGTLAGFSFDD